jgi:hypothetical protein
MGPVLAHAHQDLAAVGRIGGSLDQSQPFEAIDQARHRAAGKAGMAGDLARGRGPAHQDEIEAFEIGRIDADPARDGLAVQHARRRGAAQRQHQPPSERLLALLTRYLDRHIS